MGTGKRTVMPKKPGQHKITYKPGGLHQTTGTPAGEKIPASKMKAAARGEYGPKGVKEANMAMNVFHVGKKRKSK